jgi:hypothetical protein
MSAERSAAPPNKEFEQTPLGVCCAWERSQGGAAQLRQRYADGDGPSGDGGD